VNTVMIFWIQCSNGPLLVLVCEEPSRAGSGFCSAMWERWTGETEGREYLLCSFRQPPIVIAMQVIRFHPSALKSTDQTLTIDLYLCARPTHLCARTRTFYVHGRAHFMCTPYAPVLTILLLLTETELEQSDRNSDLSMDRCSGEKYR